jgi:CHASE1-domain containing sensor protein
LFLFCRPYTPSLYWAERVLDKDRAAVENATGIPFHAFYPNRSQYSVPKAPEYYPVFHLYGDNSAATNSSIYGYDLSGTVLGSYIFTARDTGQARATPAGDIYGTRGFFLFYPVYFLTDDELLRAPVQLKRSQVYGILVAFFDTTQIFNDALMPFDNSQLTLRAFDISNDTLFQTNRAANREIFRQVRMFSWWCLLWVSQKLSYCPLTKQNPVATWDSV